MHYTMEATTEIRAFFDTLNHGYLADNSVSEEKMAADFAKVVKGKYPGKG